MKSKVLAEVYFTKLSVKISEFSSVETPESSIEKLLFCPKLTNWFLGYSAPYSSDSLMTHVSLLLEAYRSSMGTCAEASRT